MTLRCSESQNPVFGGGTLTCSFTDDTYSSLTGTYRNSKKGTHYDIQFARELQPEEASIQPQTTWQIWKAIWRKKLNK